ncbi:MAG: SUMF1/EgtB/PvdO family nonheme iron enzyme [Verrucomicrobia bacterium]|nr:SUMF1/EgtB/PvdO family nonheme iron enzyme [Verrucomicrobiota bacterium]
MKHHSLNHVGLTVLATITLATPAFAVVSMSWTTIGDVNNLADPSTGYGAVDHAYNIGTYEVTNAQYVEFLNAKGSSNSAGIYTVTMGATGTYGGYITQNGSSGSFSYSVGSTYANMPVVGVTWFNAARFCNWLSNGQGDGSMETGAYTLNNAMSGVILANAGAQIYIPSEDEWYKAAYYNCVTSTYSRYPNGQDTVTLADANYWPDDAVSPEGLGLADVGYGTASSYGTYGQGGNAWEWDDAVLGSSRGLRGGSWGDYAAYMTSSIGGNADPSDEYNGVSFRVVSIPEPSCVVLTILASGVLVIYRKR